MAGRFYKRIVEPLRRSVVRESHTPRSGGIAPRDPNVLSSLAGEVAIRQFSADDIHRWQHEIYEQTLLLSRKIDRPNFLKVGVDDLTRMVRMYDERFFGGRLLPVAMAEGMTFDFSSRMTSAAGKMITQYPRGYQGPRQFKLMLSSTLLFQTFGDVQRPVEVTGRMCKDRLEAMQRVTEHEIVHLVEMLIWNDGDCNQPRFQSIASRYFAHTAFRHDLITQRERAARKFDIRVGDTVVFSVEGKRLSGRVNRITRRATVLVPDANGEPFSDGGRYKKFYVPLERLAKIN
jgi:hypothetical protein